MRKAVALFVMVCFVLSLKPVNARAVFYCGADLNGDGFADAAGETASCLSATVWKEPTSQWFCPVQAADCTIPTTDPTVIHECPAGMSYIESRGRCEGQPANPVYCDTKVAGYIPRNLNGSWGPWTSPFLSKAIGLENLTLTPIDATSWALQYQMKSDYTLLPWRDESCAYNDFTGTYDCTYGPVQTGGALGTARYPYFIKSITRGEIFNERVWWGRHSPAFKLDMGNGLLYPLGNAYGALGPPYGFEGLKLCNSCPSGSSPDPSQGNVCVQPATTKAVCTTGSFDPNTNECLGDYICPLGNYSCLDTGVAIPRCSPNPCIDVADPANDVTLLPDKDPMLKNDGQIDSNGACLGEIYIFSGKATRCRPGGMTVGYANNCCDSSDPVLMDSTTGSKINNVASALSTVYEMAQVGYYSYQISIGAMAAVEVGGQVVIYNMGTGAVAASYASGTATASGVMAAQGTATAGAATTTGTVSSGLSSYAGALLNPATIAVAVVVMVVMKVMVGDGCSPEDIETALLANSDYCHYLGMVCEREWKFMGCVQRAKRFCCFNSKMAKIVQEQGRPQLKAFGPSGGWGTAENPNCRGFTPQEFQQLDFSRIDLTEYFGDIQQNMSQKIQDAQSTVEQNIQQHYQQVR